jgi:hypothetical protein
MRAPQSPALRKVYKHRRSTALAKWRSLAASGFAIWRACRISVLASRRGFDTAGVNGQKYALTLAEESLLALTSPPGPAIRFRKTMNGLSQLRFVFDSDDWRSHGRARAFATSRKQPTMALARVKRIRKAQSSPLPV